LSQLTRNPRRQRRLAVVVTLPLVATALGTATASATPAARPAGQATPVTTAAAAAVPAAGSVVAYPSPGSRFVGGRTELSFRGVTPGQLVLAVRGSRSGIHRGQVRAHGDGKGASWVPAAPFRAGETVTVSTLLPVLGARGGSYTFKVAEPLDFPTDPVPTAPGDPVLQSFRSTGLRPFATTQLKPAAGTVPGLTFTAPFGPAGIQGQQIVDDGGQVVYYAPTDKRVFDFKVQMYQGKQVLTWFEGDVVLPGLGRGDFVIADTSYQVIKRVKALGGLVGDAHEFTLTPQGSAIFFSYDPVYVDTRSVGGVAHARVLDNVIQEVDLASGRLLFEWHALDHIGLAESYLSVPNEDRSYFDYAHVNSAKRDGDDAFVVSFRSTHAVLVIDRRTGARLSQLGGKRTQFNFVGTVPFSSQHDANLRPDGTITLFDNGLGAGASSATTSRGLQLRLDAKKRTATLVRELKPPMDLPAMSQGSYQQLAGGGALVNFGNTGAFFEYDGKGAVSHATRFTQRGVQTYRAYKADWHATPKTDPAAAAAKDARGVAVYASWNGATEVASWRVLGGSRADQLDPQGTAPRSGFETTLRAAADTAFVAVQALDARGAVLGTSSVVAVG